MSGRKLKERKSREKFRLDKFLGAGAFAQTYKAEVLAKPKEVKCQVGDIVAIKIPLGKEKEMTLISELIKNAALHLSLQGINARNIVQYLGFDKYDDQFVMVMEYIEGGSLRDWLGGVGEQEALSIEEALKITEQVCDGLLVAHKSHLFHRDIKPENILILFDEDGFTAKITDFGISKMLKSSELASSTTGTIYYMAKELIKGKGGSFYSDVHSMGVMMYEMMTGELPFVGEGIGEIVDNICNQELTPPMEVNPEVDSKLNYIIMTAMNRDIKKRYNTAVELLDAIKRYKRDIDVEDEEISKNIAEIQELISYNRIHDAEKRLNKLLEAYPHSSKVYLNFGEFYNKCQRYRDAIKIFEKGIEVNPKFALFYRDMALSLYNIGRKKEAINALRKAIELGLEKNLEAHANTLLKIWENGEDGRK